MNSKRQSVILVATVALASLLVGCTKDDDIEITQSYMVMLSSVCPYDMQRYMAADSLVSFITDNMGLERDTVPSSWLVRAGSISACDKEMLDRFDRACSMVDPELYAGKYSVCVYRDDSEEGPVDIAEKEFVATQGNGPDNVLDRVTITLDEDQYIYDAAISYATCYSDAAKPLMDASYTVLTGNLNHKNGGNSAYICIGVKIAKGNANTAITDSVTDEFTGEMVERALTAREAAISCIICVQGTNGLPRYIYGNKNGAWGEYKFEEFKRLGRSDGNTNQWGRTESTPSFLYFSRSNNNVRYMTKLSYHVEKDQIPAAAARYLVKSAVYFKGYCDVGNSPADMDAGGGRKTPFIYLAYRTNLD